MASGATIERRQLGCGGELRQEETAGAKAML